MIIILAKVEEIKKNRLIITRENNGEIFIMKLIIKIIDIYKDLEILGQSQRRTRFRRQ